MGSNHVLLAFGLTLLAGMATGIGSLIALLSRKVSYRVLSAALGFSAGFMIYVSFVEILAEARLDLVAFLGQSRGSWVTIIAFFSGMALIAVIDRLVPEVENPHEARRIEQMNLSPDQAKAHENGKLMRIGFMSALAIAIHNFPEGIATFTAAVKSPRLGIAIAIAIAIHNIPEGIAVSIPVYFATGSRKKAFRLSALSGFSEPLGAVIGFLVLMPIMNALTMGIMFALIAGIMVYISLDELLPTAREYGSSHLAIYGLIAGMAIMAVSVQLFK